MNRDDEQAASRGRGLDEELRQVLGSVGEPDFDYGALVAGTKARAGRIRRRQAVARGVAVVVLVPTLAGAGWVMSNSLTAGDPGGVDIASSTSTVDDAASTSDGPESTATDDAAPTSGDHPPHQNPAVLTPLTLDPPNPEWPNRWTVPDARPTGVAFLDALGAPKSAGQYPRQMPLLDFMLADEGTGGVEPHSGLSLGYFVGGDALNQDVVTINVTAWDDSTAVMADLLAGGTLTLARWDAGQPQLLDWPGHDDTDHLLVGGNSPADGWQLAGALVRQGDYLVGVSVRAETEAEAAAVAAEIAEKTAANLAYLDPAHAAE